MSKIKALITALVLTGSTAAMADSSASFSAHASVSFSTPNVRVTTASRSYDDGPIVRDHRHGWMPTPVIRNRREPVTAYRPEQRYEQWEPVREEPVQQPVVSSATFSTSMKFGRDGYGFVNIGRQANNSRVIRLQSMSGDVRITKVVITSAYDGSVQTFSDLDRVLYAGQAMDLTLSGGKPIASVAVFTDSASGRAQLSIVGLEKLTSAL